MASFLLTAFSKHLASRGETPTVVTNNRKVITTADVDVRPDQFKADNLPPNAKLLPLVHKHDGKSCPISESNQRKVQNARDFLRTTEDHKRRVLDGLDLQLKNEKNQLKEYYDDFNRFREQMDPRLSNKKSGSIKIVGQINDEFNPKIQDAKKKADQRENELLKLLNDTAAPEFIANKLPKPRHKWNQQDLDGMREDPQFMPQWLPLAQNEYMAWKQKLDSDINQLKSTNPGRDLDGHRDELDKKRRHAGKKRDDDLGVLKNKHEKDKSYLAQDWNDLKAKIDKNDGMAKAIEDMIQEEKARLSNGYSDWTWADRKKEAEAELAQLDALNQEAIDRMKERVAVESDNLRKITKNRFDELKHNQKNTSVELTHGIASAVPLTTKQRVPMPVIRPIMTPLMENMEIPHIINVPVVNNMYDIVGETGPAFQPGDLELMPIPNDPIEIIHSNTVPKLTVEKETKVTMKPHTVLKPVQETVIKTVTEHVNRPTQVVHAPGTVHAVIKDHIITTETREKVGKK